MCPSQGSTFFPFYYQRIKRSIKNSTGATGATGTKKRLRKNNINILFGLIDWLLGFGPSRVGLSNQGNKGI
jgi:hypothetical protein